jgi:hypothetical protein
MRLPPRCSRRSGPWRLRPVPDPAQKAEGTLAQVWAAEHGGADHGEHDRDGDDLAEHGMKHPMPTGIPNKVTPTPIGRHGVRSGIVGGREPAWPLALPASA